MPIYLEIVSMFFKDKKYTVTYIYTYTYTHVSVCMHACYSTHNGSHKAH